MKVRLVIGLIATSACVWPQSGEKMKARELFFTPPPPPPGSKSNPPIRAAAPDSKKTAAVKKNLPATKTAPPAMVAPSAVPPRPVQHDVEILNVAAIPLGIRYSILKRSGQDFHEVNPESTFHSGDAIRVSVEANDTGYLYIVMKGTSGNWRPLFPSVEIDNGNNRVTRGRRYQIPSRNAFVFDEQAGTEKLFLVLTRQPEADLEKLIYSLSTGKENSPKTEPKMLAENRLPIGDDLVNQLRGRMVARDLIFEKVDEKTPGDRNEVAVYVVNQNRAADSRLVIDLQLKHQ